MKTIVLLSVLILPSLALADGFFCKGNHTGLDFKVINHTRASAGTRTPAVMVISSPYVISDRKTIAVFSAKNHTLAYRGRGVYEGQVDLRYPETGRKGENIAGTKLGELKSIQLDIEFSYSHHDSSLANSVAEIPGKVFYLKRTGEILEESVVCKRYHKE
ncbi:MAG: hypothetical protein KGP28_02845 [Bdellovibrionales bacterium]|nr:hypothetical protein [Bdellovibrionales bacterium]